VAHPSGHRRRNPGITEHNLLGLDAGFRLLHGGGGAQPRAALALAQAELKSAEASLRQSQQLLTRYERVKGAVAHPSGHRRRNPGITEHNLLGLDAGFRLLRAGPGAGRAEKRRGLITPVATAAHSLRATHQQPPPSVRARMSTARIASTRPGMARSSA
jgi:hypothetical protein